MSRPTITDQLVTAAAAAGPQAHVAIADQVVAAARRAGLSVDEWIAQAGDAAERLEVVVELASPAIDGAEVGGPELYERLRLAGTVAYGEGDELVAARAWIAARPPAPANDEAG